MGVLGPPVLTLALRSSRKGKMLGVAAADVDEEEEGGYAIRNYQFASPVETTWEGIKTLAELFEQACKQHGDKNLLGTRKLISRDTSRYGWEVI